MSPLASEKVPYNEDKPLIDYPGIRLEPGRHPLSGGEHDAVVGRFTQGDLNASVWNSAVSLRMASYKPVILAIDGQSSIFPVSEQEDYSPEYKRSLWINLPARPQILHPEGQIYTISGDVANYRSLLNPLPTTNDIQGTRMSDSFGVALEQDEQMDKLKVGISSLIGPTAIGFLVVTAAGVAAVNEYGKMKRSPQSDISHTQSTDPNVNKPEVSRRLFLRFVGIGALGLLLAFAQQGSVLASTLASTNAPTERDRQFWLEVQKIIRPRFISDDYVNARTAILIDKEQDAMNTLKLATDTPGSVVMGSSHGFEANTLMGSANERRNVISRWTTNVAAMLDDFLERNNLMHLRRSARSNLLNHLALVEVFQITDPGGPDINPDFPSMIDNLVVPVGHFYSPRVEAAIHHLRL